MRTQGTLVKWNDERGFGFARTRDGGVEVFVHVSEFPRSGRRPQIGDPLSFEIRTGDDGRKQARAVTWDVALPPADFMRPPRGAPARTPARAPAGTPGPAHARRRPRRETAPASRMPALLLLGAVAIGGAWYALHRPDGVAADAAPAAAPALPAAPASAPVPAPDARRCDGRTHCSQMRSCADATWVLRHCPGTAMDGDGDGIPCEDQWCRG